MKTMIFSIQEYLKNTNINIFVCNKILQKFMQAYFAFICSTIIIKLLLRQLFSSELPSKPTLPALYSFDDSKVLAKNILINTKL